MQVIFFLLNKSKSTMVWAVIAGLAAGICSTAVVSVVNSGLNSANSPTVALAWGFAGLCGIVFVGKVISQLLVVRLGQEAFYELRIYLSRQVLSAPLRHLERIGSHRLLATLSDDIFVIANSVNAIPMVCINFSIIIGGLVYLALLSWPVFLMIFTFLVLGMFSYLLPIKWADRSFNLARKEQDSVFHHFRALIEGIKELKLHRRRSEDFFSQSLEPAAMSFKNHQLSAMLIYIVVTNWGQLLFFVCIGLILFGLPSLLEIEPAALTGYVLMGLYLMNPLEIVASWLPLIGRANVALKKIESLGLLLTEAGTEGDDAKMPPNPAWQRLELLGVTHTYYNEREDRFTLGPIDLCLCPGELVFLIGGNGSGKSTLAKLITGLYPPESGEILLDGQPITDENREWHRSHFSAVFADFYLFEKLLGLAAPNLEGQARGFLCQLQLDHKVTINDGAVSTTDLSGGQRKRLALLTAYLEDRPVYVFDEWASNQDPVFKKIFYTQILQDLKKRGKAVLVITHDDKYFHLADRIVKLDYGKVCYDEFAASVSNTNCLLIGRI